jgi:ubiquinone/menaquinone biosynthesis C-methylase UbiE
MFGAKDMNDSHSFSQEELENKIYFDRWAKTYDDGRISRWFQHTQELVISFLLLRKDSYVLDVGCGTGYAVHRLASLIPSGKACGIDISSAMIEQARAKTPNELARQIEFKQASSENIPYPNDMFDNVICTNSFHHYKDPSRALKEIMRILKPDGQFVIMENAPDLSWYTWLWDRLLRIIEKGHVRYYSSHELEGMLKIAGFQEVNQCYLRNEFLNYGKLFASIQIWSGLKPNC